jgi:hypothetical protein
MLFDYQQLKKAGLKEGGKDRPLLRRNGSACSDWRNTQVEGVKFFLCPSTHANYLLRNIYA